MKAREGSQRFSDSKNNLAPGGSLAKINSAPSSDMRKINLAPTGVWQKSTWRPKGYRFVFTSFFVLFLLFTMKDLLILGQVMPLQVHRKVACIASGTLDVNSTRVARNGNVIFFQ